MPTQPMQTSFTMRLADATVAVRAMHGQVRELCADYLVDPEAAGAPDLTVETSQGDIDRERRSATEDGYSDAYLETLAVYRKISTWAPLHRRLLIHGAVIEYGGTAYMFCAASGTGKSTHIGLWRRYLGDAVQVVNGDKPLVLIGADGPAIAYGTPWCGKEALQRNVSAPLGGICFLERAAAPGGNSIRRLKPAEAIERAFRQVYVPSATEPASHALELVDALLTRTPLYLLTVDMSEDAVRTSFEGVTGRAYPAHA